jgi:PAS domain S-box-containing protein
VITDTGGIIRYVNPAFEATTGYSAAEAVGKTPRILKSGQHPTDFYRNMWQQLLQGNAFRGTLVNRKKTGELYWAEQTITPITDDAGHISQFVSVLKDITDLRKQQEHEIQLRLARQAQQRFYAAAVPPAGLDVGRAVYPAVETGGDYIDFVPAPPKRIGIAVGDVSGHGFDSALLMALTRAYVRSYSAEGLPPAEIFARVNPMLHADLEDNRYVTLLLVHLDPVENVLCYASAGHAPGFVLGPTGEIEHVMDSTGVPLGLFQEYAIENRTLRLNPGSLVVLLTDGATEAGDPDGAQLGLAGVIECVRAHRTLPPQQIADAIYQCARYIARDQPQQDDISAVVLKLR